MPLRVRLLGRPGLEHDGESRRLEGHKPWALLTYLLLEPRAPTRRELADLLWSETDDPLGSLRWSLSQVRKAINPPAEIAERDGRIKIDAEVLVEIHTARGDRERARTYVAGLARRYRDELAIEPPASISRPLDRPARTAAEPLLRLDVQARALLDIAKVRFWAGDSASAREI